MATTTLVDQQIDDGRLFVRHLLRNGIDVRVALWVLSSDEESWSLFIASPLVSDIGLSPAYGRLYEELSNSGVRSIARSNMKLIKPEDAIALDAAKYQRSTLETDYGGRKLGDLIIERAFIYPSDIC